MYGDNYFGGLKGYIRVDIEVIAFGWYKYR